MKSYGIVTYRTKEGDRAGLLVDGQVIDIASTLDRKAFGTTAGILEAWAQAGPLLEALASDPNARRQAPEGLRLLAPVPKPMAVYCVGANYRDHVDNMARARGLPPEPDPRKLGMPPWHFLKTGHCVVGPDTDVRLSGDKLDWEAELAVIIGATASKVSAERALQYVAGYTIANDLSARDRIFRKNGDPKSPFYFDFMAQKNFDGACPLGPAIVPAKFIADPQALSIKLWVNDVLRIDSSSAEMIYSVAEQIAHISSFITLHPGDVILTGTPAGVGAETDEYLHAGDRVRIAVEGLGMLTTRII